MYGYQRLIGYLWADQEEGMVPLYSAWSSERSDTRTQVGDKFESYYSLGVTLLGYIYEKTQVNMVPLWNGWSGERHDTRTQVGSEFEFMYGYPSPMGYIRPAVTSISQSLFRTCRILFRLVASSKTNTRMKLQMTPTPRKAIPLRKHGSGGIRFVQVGECCHGRVGL